VKKKRREIACAFKAAHEKGNGRATFPYLGAYLSRVELRSSSL